MIKLCVVCETPFHAKNRSKCCSERCWALHRAYKDRKRYALNPSKFKNKNMEARKKDPEKFRLRDREKYIFNSEKEKEKRKIRYDLDPVKYREKARLHRLDNLEKCRSKARERYTTDREKHLRYSETYRLFNQEKINDKQRKIRREEISRTSQTQLKLALLQENYL